MVGVRFCVGCEKEKEETAFKKSKGLSKDYFYCKDCRRQRAFEERLKYRYGIDEDEYNYLLQKANFKCEICLKDVAPKFQHKGTKERACIDHNHQSNSIRGILCADCNWAIGLFKDNPELCISAANYLKGWK